METQTPCGSLSFADLAPPSGTTLAPKVGQDFDARRVRAGDAPDPARLIGPWIFPLFWIFFVGPNELGHHD